MPRDAFLIYVDDWLSSCRIELMDAHEERGYFRLLMRAWKQPDCGLPTDDLTLAAWSRMGTQWFRETADRSLRTGKTSGQKVRECFIERDGRLFNERQLVEREYQNNVRQKRSVAAVEGQDEAPGSVYFVQRPSDQAIKIGSSLNVPARIAKLRYKTRQSLVLIKTVRVDNMREAERCWHERFADKRLFGEWFSITKEDIAIALDVTPPITPGDITRVNARNLVSVSSLGLGSDLKTHKAENMSFGFDETFVPFVEAAHAFWTDLIEEDIYKSWQFSWRNFDLDQKLLATAILRQRIEYRQDSRYVPRPPKYLESGEWKRRPREPTTNGAHKNAANLQHEQIVHRPNPRLTPGA